MKLKLTRLNLTLLSGVATALVCGGCSNVHSSVSAGEEPVVAAQPTGEVDADEDEDEDGEVEIPLDLVPAAVKLAALGAVPGIQLQEAEKETEDGQVVYDLEGVAGGVLYEVEVAEDGTVLEVEREDDEDDED